MLNHFDIVSDSFLVPRRSDMKVLVHPKSYFRYLVEENKIALNGRETSNFLSCGS